MKIKFKSLNFFQASKEQEVTEKFSRTSKSNLMTKAADLSDLMSFQPQCSCSPSKVEVRYLERNLP